MGLHCFSEPEPVSHVAVEKDCTGGLVIEVFNNTDKIGAGVVLFHGCQQNCMPNPVDGLLEVYEDMVKDLLVLEMFLTKDLFLGLSALWCSFLLRSLSVLQR